MVILKLAFRNLVGGGLRTWLNALVLSFSFVLIIFSQGLFRGMDERVSRAMIDAEYGGGQYWQEQYDPYDPLTLQDAHASIPEYLQNLIEQGKALPILVIQGTMYPEGRIMPVLIKGIDINQKILNLPSEVLKNEDEELPALIGSRMAKNAGLKIGDYVTVRWRDANGTFDARDARIVQVMKTTVQSIDNGQIWVPLKILQDLTDMQGEASIVVLAKDEKTGKSISGWDFKGYDFLLADIRTMVKSKQIGSTIFYFVLLLLAMLAIFDTQILSIFRRRKEIGTLIALGMTRSRVIRLFTLEGALHGILAILVGAVYGTPLLVYFATKGLAIGESFDSYGFALGEKMLPTFTAGLVLGTTLIVLIVTTIVSYLPTRKIGKLEPTEALRSLT
jgi:ABC-type lipoprotein release transport system permease subunit